MSALTSTRTVISCDSEKTGGPECVNVFAGPYGSIRVRAEAKRRGWVYRHWKDTKVDLCHDHMDLSMPEDTIKGGRPKKQR